MSLPPLTLYLAAPRGFCAGVDRAIKIVEMALQKWGAPVYVRHEIVHNPFVVESLRRKGAVFVEELSEIPDTDAPVIFSAHGVAKAVLGVAGGDAHPALADAIFLDVGFLDALEPNADVAREDLGIVVGAVRIDRETVGKLVAHCFVGLAHSSASISFRIPSGVAVGA